MRLLNKLSRNHNVKRDAGFDVVFYPPLVAVIEGFFRYSKLGKVQIKSLNILHKLVVICSRKIHILTAPSISKRNNFTNVFSFGPQVVDRVLCIRIPDCDSKNNAFCFRDFRQLPD